MTVLNESGVPDVLSPLCGLKSLTEKLSDTLILVAGTRTEAHLVHAVPDALSTHRTPSREDSRVVSIVLEPGDSPQQGRVASRLIEAAAGFRRLEMVLLVVGRSARLLGIDADFEARVASRRLGLPVKTITTEQQSSNTLFTDLEDRALASLVSLCPADTPVSAVSDPPPKERGGLLGGLLGRDRDKPGFARRSPVVLLGSKSPGREELSSELTRAGVEVAGSVPVSGGELPAVGEGTVVAVADPYLDSAAREAKERGAEVVRTLAPIGPDGTSRFVQDVATASGLSGVKPGRARSGWQNLEPLRNRIRGKRIFFAGDTGLEIPVARFLMDAGAVVLEVGAPRLDRRLLSTDIQTLSAHTDVIESPDPKGQIERIDATRPDVVVASAGLYAPLVARGHLCRSSLDFLGASIHGYEGARRILELFIRTFERAEALDSVKL